MIFTLVLEPRRDFSPPFSFVFSSTILLAPDSRGRTWDFILGDYGPDVRFIDRALDHVFKRYNVHPGHIGIAGFSDGASYALSLGTWADALAGLSF